MVTGLDEVPSSGDKSTKLNIRNLEKTLSKFLTYLGIEFEQLRVLPLANGGEPFIMLHFILQLTSALSTDFKNTVSQGFGDWSMATQFQRLIKLTHVNMMKANNLLSYTS